MRVHLHATPYLLPVPLNIDGSACELQFNVASLGFSSKFNCFNLRNTRRHQQPLGNPSNSTLNPLPLPTYSLYTQAHIHVHMHTRILHRIALLTLLSWALRTTNQVETAKWAFIFCSHCATSHKTVMHRKSTLAAFLVPYVSPPPLGWC